MEGLKKLRIPLRSSFTKTANKLDECLKTEVINSDEIAVLITQLNEKWMKLSCNDGGIIELLQNDIECNQEDFDTEYETIEIYHERYLSLKTKAERLLNRQDMENASVVSESVTRRKFKLPRIELKKFNGDIKEWLGFWGQFRKIHEDVDIDPEDKFQYLSQATEVGSRARDLVDSFPPTADNYLQVIECMKARFGRDEILIEVYVRELLSLVLRNSASQNKTTSLLKLYDKVETHLRALETLGVTSDKYAAMLYPLVESCLPDEVIRIWERNVGSIDTTNEKTGMSNKLSTLMNFLKTEVEGEERISLAKDSFGLDLKRRGKFAHVKEKVEPENNIPTATGLFTGDEANRKLVKQNMCIFCGKTHASQDCRHAYKLTLEDKKNIIQQKACCFRCLKPGHRVRDCRSKINCTKCQNRHYTIMCSGENLSNNYSKKSKDSNSGNQETTDTALGNRTCTHEIILQTLFVRLRGKGKAHVVRAIIDTGSQRSYISKRAAVFMRYDIINEENVIHNLFGGAEAPEKHLRYRVFLSSLQSNYHCNFEVLDQLKICADIPIPKLDECAKEMFDHNIVLSEQLLSKEQRTLEIDLLIGADVAGKLFTGKIERLSNGLVGVHTYLGWTLMGKNPKEEKEENTMTAFSLLLNERKISDLWDLDTLGITDPAEKRTRKELEEASKEKFLLSLKRDSSGRYETSLPWLETHPPLPNNRVIAERRLKSTVKNLQSNGYLKAYEDVFNEWLEEGVIELVDSSKEDNANCHYLPHRAVIKMNSTTKIRPVFDASAKEKNSVSLNDCLEKGSNYIELIPSILNRFRLRKFGVIADIRKAFLQISLNEKDRDFLRFLWWQEGNSELLQIFRHRRVVFGVSSSPFLLGATLEYHLDNVPSHLQEVATILKNSMYVDNCVTSLDTEEQLYAFINQSKEIMSSAKFDLRGWRHNKPRCGFNIECPDDVLASSSTPNDRVINEEKETVSVLGMMWNLQNDTLCCDVKELNDFYDEKVTKRTILSLAHKIFDPIGITSPVTLVPKLLMQECWRKKLSWDVELPDEYAKKLQKWVKELVHLKNIVVPRTIACFGRETKLSLHVFCDASQLAYATCIYLRSENEQEVSCQLIQARARVAPLKPISISRLELLACSIGARLMASVTRDLSFQNVPIFYWSDSMNALYWIKSGELWATFVMNRVTEIRSLSNPNQWHHVPGDLNPADLPSRGCSSENLSSRRWWEGPEWLKKPEEEWPKIAVSPCTDAILAEKGKRTVITSSNLETDTYYHRISSYIKIVRVNAWIYRFYMNAKFKTSRTAGELTLKEIKNAELRLLKSVQEEEFLKGINDRVRSLRPVMDEKGLLRVKTLISRRKDTKNFRLPIILPSNHPVVLKLIAWKHKELGHAGVQILMNNLRERYWILRSRKTIRQVIHQCTRCRRFTMPPSSLEAPVLPEDRIKEANVFEITGVDLAGPLILRGGQKAWIVLFTCAVYRAVHLELVTSLSTEAFLQSLRRFIARRGRPSIIYSDNGSNFNGANTALEKLNLEKLQLEITLKNIVWKFNPPSAPWWGGWWERLVGLMKQILRKVLGKASLHYEELNTILCDTESLINSRPLTYLSEDVEDLVPLTPSMFLQEIKEVGVPDIDNVDAINIRKRYQHLQKVRVDLRKRFRSEYLGNLRQSAKVNKNTRSVSVGDIVLIGSDNLRRLQWPLAKITEVYPGKDGVIRVVKLKTKFGTQIRPVRRLYPLEMSMNEGSVLREKASIDSKKNRARPKVPDFSEKEIPESKQPTNVKLCEQPIKTRCGRIIRPPRKLDL